MDNKFKSKHRLVRFAYYALLAAVVASIIYCIALLFVPLIASIIISLIFDPVVNYLETRGIKRIKAIIGIYAVLIVLAIGIAVVIVPRAITEVQTIVHNLPQYRGEFETGIYNLQNTLQKRFPGLTIPDFVPFIQQRFYPKQQSLSIESLINHLSSLFTVLSVLVIIPFVTFYLLVDGHRLQRNLLSLIPNSYFEMCLLIFHKVTESVKLYLRGQLIDASAVGILTIIGLAIIGLPYSIVIGIIAGLGSLIPYLGPVIGCTPALIEVALSPQGLTIGTVVPILVVFVVVHLIESNIVYPLAIGRSVDLHWLAIIIAIAVGSEIGGIVGMLVVIPLISITKVVIQVMYSYLKSYSII